MPISRLGILHIYNIWNPVIRIAIYLVVRKFYLRGLFGNQGSTPKLQDNKQKSYKQ